jgi:hypothetical protein
MTNSIAEIEEARCIFVIGSNTTECHPLIARRIYRGKEMAPDSSWRIPGTFNWGGLRTWRSIIAWEATSPS